MKSKIKIFFISVLSLIFISDTFAQSSFCDDFESYSSGSYIGSSSNSWTTWTQPYTATEDVQVTNALSNSGSNSIYFNGTGNPGGPSDVILPFGSSTPYTSGSFVFTSNFYVINGAYFNFQAQNTPGTQWAFEAEMTTSGLINFTHWNGSSSTTLLTANYPLNQWFEIKMEIDLDLNIWEVFIDNVSQGSFANPTNQIASLDLYPMTGHQFYVDDVCYTYTPSSTSSCPPNETEIIISITTDDYPSETSWQLVDQNGGGWSISPGDLTNPNTTYTYSYCVPDANCYTFTIFDSFGDGICCTWGNGSYYVSYGGTTVASGGSFAGSDITSNIGNCSSTSACASNESEIVISITTDDYPTETYWQLVDQNGTGFEILAGDLTSANTTYTWSICVPDTNCYDFTIFDSYGDGLCCTWGNGSYYVTLDGSTIVSGGSFGYSENTYSIGNCTVPPSPCPPNEVEIIITVNTDDYPTETSWFLMDQYGGGWTNVPISSSSTNSTLTWTLCVPDSNCYSFTILDSYGDGICCAWGSGSYNISYGGVIVASGGSFVFAEENCGIGICTPMCQINIPSTALNEGESCGADVNNGCDDNWAISNFTIQGVTDDWSWGYLTLFGVPIGEWDPDLYIYMTENNVFNYYSDYYLDTWYPNSFSMYANQGITTPLDIQTTPLYTTPWVSGQTFSYNFSVYDDDDGLFSLLGSDDYIGSYTLPTNLTAGTHSITTSGGSDGNAYVDYTVVSPVSNYTPLANNSVINGNFWAADNNKDTDWYEFVLNDSSDFFLSSISEIPYNIVLIDGSAGCENKIVIDSAFAMQCDTINIQQFLAPGTYWLVVFPSVYSCVPCSDSADYLLDVSWVVGCNMVSSVNVTPANCTSINGSIDLTVSGGVLPYTYSWNNGSTTQDLTNVPVGYYDVLIYTSNNCSDTLSSIYVPDYPSPIGLTYTTVPESVSGLFDGSIDIDVTGGVPSLTYNWSGPNSFSNTTEDISSLEAGMYYITVIDVNGCSFSDSILVLEFSIDVGVSDFISPSNACNLDSAEQIIVQITNYNNIDATDFVVSFQYNGQIYSDSVNTIIAAGDSIIYTFNTTINASNTGLYSLTSFTSHNLDYDHINDTSIVSFTNYYHDFYNSDYEMSFEPYQDFSGWIIEDANNDSYIWNVSQYTGVNQSYGIFYNYNFNGSTAADDWLISQCFQLDSGQTYNLSFKFRAASASFPEDMNVHIGTVQQGSALTTMLLQMNTIMNIVYDSTSVTFTVPTSDTYYIGWHVVSNANMWRIDLDDINLSMNVPNIYGCTDSLAINFNPLANTDDGSCAYCIYGCMDSTAFNYDTLATCPDNSCVTIMYGCTDPLALNYYAGANIDDGSCIYFMFGCTDSMAINYSPGVLIDDGSCIYPIYGCTDSTAINYDTLANTDDGSCIASVYGCTDSTAFNYYAGANIDDSSCIYAIYGCTDPCNSCNYNPLANMDDGSCVYSTACMATGCIDPLALNYDSTACYDDSSCVYCIYGCMDSTALNYDSLVTCDDGSCTYPTTCSNPVPTGIYIDEIIQVQAKIHWDNMSDSNCMVLKYYVNVREVGTSSWSWRVAQDAGLCNQGLPTTSKVMINLTASTDYEYRVKAFYCNTTGSSSWSPMGYFTTADDCPNVTNLTATPGPQAAKVVFSWDTVGAYSMVRIKLRVDSISNPIGSDWQMAGGFGVNYPALSVNKWGLTAGETYRGQARTWCNPAAGLYRSPTWSPLVWWTQPTAIRVEGGTTINNLVVYPNPSRDIFNVTFTSEDVQNLEVRIINVIGEVVYTESLDKFVGEYTKQVDLATYTKGVYFLEITTDNGVINKKLILQ